MRHDTEGELLGDLGDNNLVDFQDLQPSQISRS